MTDDGYVPWPRRLLAAARHRWLIVLATFLVLGGAGAAYVMTIPVQYSSTGVISFQPRLDEPNGRDLTALLTERYPAVISSTSSVSNAAIAAGVTPGQVSAGLIAAVQPDTLNMIYTVTLDSATQAQAAAQALYLSTLEYNVTDPFLEALRVETPTPATAVPGAPKVLLLGAVALLAAIIGIVVALLVEQLAGSDGR